MKEKGVKLSNPVMGFSMRLDQAICDSHKSLTQIKRETGLSRSCVWGYLQETKNPSVLSLIKLSRCLRVSTDWLLGLKERE